jgi:response regulator RpfG family c-di-GMP phosphodiesterase
MNQDEIVFLAESPAPPGPIRPRAPWKVIVADDEPGVHHVTELALGNFTFDGRPLAFIHANSGAETFNAARDNPDAAVLLLDVVMETEHAGLEVVRRIRDELGNTTMRIVLRTGQPGAAPETEVISRYDINDYKEKTELTASKLFTLMYACLRAYRDIVTIQASRRGLERIIEASTSIFRLQSLDEFASAVVDHIDGLLTSQSQDRADGLHVAALVGPIGGLQVIAGTGAFAGAIGQPVATVLDATALAQLTAHQQAGRTGHLDNAYIGVFRQRSGPDHVVYVSGYVPGSDIERDQLDVFVRNVGISFDNIQLKDSIESAQREIIFRLGGVVETRSKETGNHVRRVAKISRLLGLEAGLTERQARIFEYASPMHDVGKVGIPDEILNKPGKLTPEEWAIMQTHVTIGHDILAGSDHEILQTGALIALDHHEKWDGTGYPAGKRGEAISLHGRVTAVADVFDALASHRCYKPAWPLERVIEHFREQRGRHFDPNLVDLLFAHIDAVIEIRDAYRDD